MKTEAKETLLSVLLEMVKTVKQEIIRKQMYEKAAMLRNLEKILTIDGGSLSEDSLTSIESVVTMICETHVENKNNMETTTQNKSLNLAEAKTQISDWLKNYANNSKQKGYIIGVSGGIDSAVCSTLCALTGLPLTVIKMSIHQAADQADRGTKHIEWLKANFPNVKSLDIDLTEVYDKEIELLTKAGALEGASDDQIFLTSSNTRSRLRMVTLYGVGGAHNLLVCGTGNKVEDYGVGFFTKFGDGGVDLSPIGELMKSEVYALGKELGVIQEILDARPTDGLWDDGRTDEDQIGATYDELEWALNYAERFIRVDGSLNEETIYINLSDRQKIVLTIYWKRHAVNAHKMSTPPICDLSNLRK